MTRIFKLMLTLSILLALLSQGSAATARQLSEPEKNFEHLWKTFDRNYALFGPKNIDWDALYKIYRPRVTAQTSDDELFDILSSLLGHLNDNHVRLQSPRRSFQSGILGDLKLEDFSLSVATEKYLKGKFQRRVNNAFTYGWLTDSIGYFHFPGFGRLEESAAAVDEIVKEFKDAKGIVIDVRGNGGGDDRVGKAIADRFADRKRLYMKTRIRDGAAHSDFTAPKYWYVEPGGPAQFTRPVILLTHRHSVSAAENFALAMRVLPHVTVVGDATSGVFADVYGDTMPNGWRFSVSFKLFEDQNGFCWEGIGVPSDIRQTNKKSDIEQKRDKVIELAVALVESGALKPQSEESSLKELRDSLVKNLSREIDEKGIDSALRAYRRMKASKPEPFYVDEDEMEALGARLLREGKRREATEVMKLRTLEFPRSYGAFQKLGDAYSDAGDSAQFQANYKKSMELNRQSYPWERTAYSEGQLALKGVKLLSKKLARDIEEKGIEAALAAFESGKAAGPGTYTVNEEEINGLGYQLLAGRKLREAIEVFKLNTREFPNSWNTYDSLGEAYNISGEKELAIKNYRRSIELNPQNTNGIEILKKLEGTN